MQSQTLLCIDLYLPMTFSFSAPCWSLFYSFPTFLHIHNHHHPPPSSELLPSPCILVIFLSSLLSPPPYSLPSLFSSLPRFDPSLHPSLHPAGSAGIEAAFVSAVSSTLWRRRAEKQEAGRDGQKTWRETETKIEMGKWDKKTRTVGRQIQKKEKVEERGISLDQLPGLFKSLIFSRNSMREQISCVWGVQSKGCLLST